jgi:hypothetical protein
MPLFYPNNRPYTKYSNDNLIGAVLSATPIPGLGAGYLSHQSAKEGPEDKYWGHFASGMVPGTAAGLGAAVGSGVASHKLLNRLGRTRNLPPALKRWAPIAVGALAGALIEPTATNAGLGAYKFFNRD